MGRGRGHGCELELVVVDDGSTDATLTELAGIHDERLRVVGQVHRGRSAARNAGAAVARGDWLVFLDDDDDIGPEWLSVLAQAQGKDDVELVMCGITRVLADGSRDVIVAPSSDAPVGKIAARLLAGTFAVRRSLFVDVGGYDDELSHAENTDLGLRLVRASRARGNRIVVDPRSPFRYARRGRRKRPRERTVAVLDAAVRTLTKYPDLRDVDRTFWLSMLDTAGVCAARLGRMREARSYFLKAALTFPPSAKRGARVVLALSRRASARVWESSSRSGSA